MGHAGEVSRYLSVYLDEMFGDAARALLERLEKVTLADMDENVRAMQAAATAHV